MTESEIDTLREELRALRSEFRQRFEACETRLTKLEVHMDERPDRATVYQTSIAVSLSLIATAAVALLFIGTFFAA